MDELKEVDTSNLDEIEKIVNKDIKQYKIGRASCRERV